MGAQEDLILVARARCGDAAARDALTKRYLPLAKRYEKISPEAFSLAMSALHDAIRSFKPDNGTDFRLYATIVVHRRMAKERKRLEELKKKLSKFKSLELASDSELEGVFTHRDGSDPHGDLFARTILETMERTLSGPELVVLQARLRGLTLQEIITETGWSAGFIQRQASSVKATARQILEEFRDA